MHIESTRFTRTIQCKASTHSHGALCHLEKNLEFDRNTFPHRLKDVFEIFLICKIRYTQISMIATRFSVIKCSCTCIAVENTGLSAWIHLICYRGAKFFLSNFHKTLLPRNASMYYSRISPLPSIWRFSLAIKSLLFSCYMLSTSLTTRKTCGNSRVFGKSMATLEKSMAAHRSFRVRYWTYRDLTEESEINRVAFK